MKDKERTRITITCYDKEGLDLISHAPLWQFIEATEETGMCVCRCTNDRIVYIEKSNAGYVIRAWKEKENK